jgi:serine/threonine protein kinase
MVCGDIPFESDAQIKRAQLYWRPELNISHECKDLISRCLVIEPQSRIKLNQLKTHPWLAKKESQPLDISMKKSVTQSDLASLDSVVSTPASVSLEDPMPTSV